MKGATHMKTFEQPVERDRRKAPEGHRTASQEALLRSLEVTPGIGKDQGDFTYKMNSLLANEFALFTKTLKYHWNVQGPRFHSMHEFLDEQYNQLLKAVDGVAERIREIGQVPIGTLHEATRFSNIEERPGFQPEADQMLSNLVTGHEKVANQIREMIGDLQSQGTDPGTEDFLTSLLKQHEDMIWMLKSHIH
jgi:starvation-inducible DNA-binding protein